MATSTRVNAKIRQPRAKATGILVGVRLQPEELAKVDKAAKADGVTRPEAIRKMIERS